MVADMGGMLWFVIKQIHGQYAGHTDTIVMTDMEDTEYVMKSYDDAVRKRYSAVQLFTKNHIVVATWTAMK